MPQFILSGADTSDFRALPQIAQGYIMAMLWTSEEALTTEDEDSEEPRPTVAEVSFDLLSLGSLAACLDTCADFAKLAAKPIAQALAMGSQGGLEQIGHDLWLTSQGQGVNFADRDSDFYGSQSIRDALDAICDAHFRGDVDVYAGEDGRIYTDNAAPEPVAYWYRRGDGNEGNFKRELVYLEAGDSAAKALRALVVNEWKPGASRRRWIAKNFVVDWDGDQETAPQGIIYEGPRGETVFGAAWLTAELEPAEIDADGSDDNGRRPAPIRSVLDKGARAILGAPAWFETFRTDTGAVVHAGPFSEDRAREICGYANEPSEWRDAYTCDVRPMASTYETLRY